MESLLNDLNEQDKISEINILKDQNRKLAEENTQLKEKLEAYSKHSSSDIEVYYQLQLSNHQKKIAELESQISALRSLNREMAQFSE